MTVLRQDVDTAAVIAFSNSSNRSAFIQDFVKENYGAASPLVLNMAKVAFKEALELN